MIKINNLNKYYNKGKDNEIHVINDVTLELPNTGLISFLGQSGSGKTTLLNVIGGLDKAKGSIQYDSLVMDKYNMHKLDQFRSKEIGYVFQNYNLLLEETVYSNLEIALEMIGVFDKDEQEKRIEYTLKAVGMYKYRKKRAFALSGGQQQRVSIARALVKQAKVIIADEPTGNLDSENTIEVMNILKKISQSALVLMVTHNEEVANFYSDQVVKIKDGCITETYLNDGTTSLNTEQANTIYLKDMSLTEEKGDFVSLKYYSSKEAKPLELRIIEKNGTYFISASEKLKLIEDTNLRVIDSHYQALKQEEVYQYNFDTSWYSAGKGKQNVLKRVFHSLKESFNKMRFSKRRTKFLYSAFFTIGVLLAICVIGFSNYYLIDDTKFGVDKRFNMIKSDGYVSYDGYEDALYSIADQVTNMTATTYLDLNLHEIINYSEEASYYESITLISYYGSENLKLLAGTAPKENEFVISKKVADNIIKELSAYYLNYDSLVGLTTKFGFNNRYRISGVVDSEYAIAYMDDATFLEKIGNTNYVKVTTRSYELEHKFDTYTMIAGRDFNEEDKDKNYILVNHFTEYLGEIIQENGKEYEVIGIYEFKDYPTEEFIPMLYSYSNEKDYSEMEKHCYNYKDYKIVAGRDAASPYECIASIYSKYVLNSPITIGNRKYTIVGFYYSDSDTMGRNVLFSREACMLDYGTWFQIKDPAAVQETLNASFYAINVYKYYYNNLKEIQHMSFLIFGIFALVLIIIIAVFIYFIMRSRMISDIYPIGVYRSIGASRFKIVLRFVSDILVTITLTALIGYLLTTFIFQTIAANVNNTLSMNALKSSYLFSFLGGLILYVLNLFFGLLPIIMLMRKTPAEIIAKYDI